MAIQNNNRKFLDQAGIVKLVQGLTAKYSTMYVAKGSETAEGVSYNNTAVGGDVTVKVALDVLVDNVVRQDGQILNTKANMKEIDAKIDAEVTRAKGAEQTNANAIAAINKLLGQGQTGNAGSIADRLAALESFKAGHSHEAIEKAIAKLDGAVDVEGSVKKQIKAAMDAHELAREEVDAAITDRIKALEDANKEGGAVKEAIDAVQDALDTFVDETFAQHQQTVQAGLDGKVDDADFKEAVGRVEDLEEFVEAHDHKVMEQGIADNKAALEVLNGDENEEGSVKKQIKDAIDEVNGAAKTLAGRVKANEDKLAGLEEGCTTVQAAIDKAEADAKAHAEQKIADLVDSAPDAMNTLNELAKAINDNKDIYDAYIKEHATAMATMKSDLQKEIDDDVKVEADRAKVEEARIEGLVTTEKGRAEGIEQGLQAAIDKLNGTDTEAGSVAKAVKDAVDAQALIDAAQNEQINAKVAQSAYDAKVAEIEKAIDNLEALHAENGAVDQKVAAAAQAAADAQADVDALEEVVGDIADGKTVAGLIADNAAAAQAADDKADAAQDDVDALAEVVGKKAEGEAAATGVFADIAVVQAEVDAAEGRIDVLEGKAHEHANKEELDKFENGDKAALDKAVDDIATINNAENGILAQAKAYTDQIIALTNDDIAAAIGEAFGTQA